MKPVLAVPVAALVATSLLFLGSARASAQWTDYRRVEVTDGVHVFVSPDPGAGNAVAIVSAGEAVVVDATTSPMAARAIVAEIERLGVTRLRGLVNTHWHPDHFLGNQAFLERFPEAPIISHARTPADMAAHALPDLSDQIVRLEERIAQRDSLLAADRNASGEPMNAEEREALQQRQGLFRELVAGLDEVRPVLPSITFEAAATIRVGELSVELLHLGPAHSFGDILVHVPGRRVLVAGDVVTLPYPGAGDGYSSITGWREALRRVLAMDFDLLIPGHGDALQDRTYLEDLHQLMSGVLDQVGRGIERGEAPETIVESLDVSTFTGAHLGGDERLMAGFHAFFLQPAVAIAHRELVERREGGR